jgi:hypothetical protein
MNKHTCLWDECVSTEIFARGLCKRDHMRARRAGRMDEFVAPPRTCFYCEAEFRTQKNGKTKFCALECQRLFVAARRISQRIKYLGARVCLGCEGQLGLSTSTDSAFCSVKCQQGSWYEANAEHAKAKARIWNASNPDLKQRQSMAWYEANKGRALEMAKAWRSANPDAVREISRASALRRRARKAAGVVEDFALSEIWEREQGICWLCETEIDPLKKWPHPESKTLEHVIPLARGGSHTRENVALAHLVCNLRKGTQIIDRAV